MKVVRKWEATREFKIVCTHDQPLNVWKILTWFKIWNLVFDLFSIHILWSTDRYSFFKKKDFISSEMYLFQITKIPPKSNPKGFFIGDYVWACYRAKEFWPAIIVNMTQLNESDKVTVGWRIFFSAINYLPDYYIKLSTLS